MEPVECRKVIRSLHLKGRTPQETFDEMKGTYGGEALSMDLESLLKQLPDMDDQLLPLKRQLSVKLKMSFWKIDALLFVK